MFTSLKGWYHVWNRNEYLIHKERYYSLLMKCYAWINGKGLDQGEVFKPVVAVCKFGPAGTHCPLLIGSKINFVRSGGEELCPSEGHSETGRRHLSSCSRGRTAGQRLRWSADKDYKGQVSRGA